jgi:hypothetical protein
MSGGIGGVKYLLLYIIYIIYSNITNFNKTPSHKRLSPNKTDI